MEEGQRSPEGLIAAWRAAGHQAAVTLGAAVALLSLMSDTPVRIASMRGAIAWAATLFATSLGAWFIRRTYVAVPPETTEAEATGEDGEAPLA